MSRPSKLQIATNWSYRHREGDYHKLINTSRLCCYVGGGNWLVKCQSHDFNAHIFVLNLPSTITVLIDIHPDQTFV